MAVQKKKKKEMAKIGPKISWAILGPNMTKFQKGNWHSEIAMRHHNYKCELEPPKIKILPHHSTKLF